MPVTAGLLSLLLRLMLCWLLECQHKIVQEVTIFWHFWHQKSECFSISLKNQTKIRSTRRFTEEAVATDPESVDSSELTVESSGAAVASKGKALRKAAAKRAARRQSAPEKPKAGGGEKKLASFLEEPYCFYWYLTLFVFLLSYSVNSLRAELFGKRFWHGLCKAQLSQLRWKWFGSSLAICCRCFVLLQWNHLRFSFAERDFQGPNGTVGHNEHGIEKESADS